MEEKKQPQQQQLQIELTPEVANGTYSNLAIINHSNLIWSYFFLF